VPIAELVRAGRVRELRGIGPGIEARLRELVETGEIAELRELERELAPELVGLGRYLGLGAKRSVEIARALGVRTPDEFRAAAAAGRLRDVPGVGPKTEARCSRRSRARGAAPRRGGAAAQPRAGARRRRSRRRSAARSAGDVRRWRDSCEQLAVVCARAIRRRCSTRFAALPQIVAVSSGRAARASA
jgi:DNA polymerase (family 10)